jgi:hypothetical protein
MHNAPTPDQASLRYVQSFLASEFSAVGGLLGEDRDVWGSVHHPFPQSTDLGAIKHPAQDDPVIRWLAILVALVQRKIGWTSKGAGSFAYHFTSWVLGIFAYFLPIVSILLLVDITSLAARLIIIAVFHVLIAISMSVFTDARRMEVFAVTAA